VLNLMLNSIVKISILFMAAKIILFFETTHPKRYRAGNCDTNERYIKIVF
jgi:hypothetical protein